MATQSKLAGALSRNPKLERVSPGVYRNRKGDLVTAGGRALPRPAQPPAPQPGDYRPAVFPGQQPQEFIQPPPNVPVQPWEQMGGFQPGIRPAMQTPYDRYRFALQQQNGQDVGQQATQLADQQNPPINYPRSNMQPPDMALRQPAGSMPRGSLLFQAPEVKQGGPLQDPRAEQEAQRRADAIRRGEMVTMDYRPERDARVDEILGRAPQQQPRFRV